MELFRLLGEIAIDSTKAEKSIDSVSKESNKIGEGFQNSNIQAGRSLAEIAAANGKTVNEIRSEASKIAAEYRKQGMDASEAMKKAYSDIGYESGKASKKMADDAKDAESKSKKSFDGIGNAVDAIVDFFDVTLKFSGISLPDISIKWATEPAWMYEAAQFLGMKGVPKFSVTWNAEGAVFGKPTIIPTLNGLQGVGEAGKEAVAPIDVLQQYVSEAVHEQNAETNRMIKRLYDLLATYIPHIADNSDKDIILNDGVLVGRLAPSIDRELGSITIKKNRGNM